MCELISAFQNTGGGTLNCPDVEQNRTAMTVLLLENTGFLVDASHSHTHFVLLDAPTIPLLRYS